jgi:trimeric autotransporter adhesin
VRIGSDLAVQTITAPAKTAAGASISISDTTSNQGGGDAPASLTVFYLSTSSTGGSGDVLLDGNRAVPPLAAGTSSTGATTVTIPAGIAGTFYLLAQADAGNAVIETNEVNNTRSRSISIGPDLSFTSWSLSPTSLAAGANLTVSETIANQGGDVAAPSTTRFYLSTNSTLDGSDLVLSPARAIPQLAVGASSSGSTIVTIPSGIAPGTYYVIAQADSDGVVPESVETNNVTVIRWITVTAGP